MEWERAGNHHHRNNRNRNRIRIEERVRMICTFRNGICNELSRAVMRE